MTRNLVGTKRNIQGRAKVKTGCTTCRIRKVKCDENKPSCLKCVNTGRTCDGYQSPFIISLARPATTTCMLENQSDASHQPVRVTSTKIDPVEVDLLNRYFSIKTIFNVNLGCDQEARQILQASLTDSNVRHALLSLRALREDFETFADHFVNGHSSTRHQTPSYNYGLQQYSLALSGLVSELSSQGSTGLKSLLLCCQIFISIEQVQRNYAIMAQHIIRGLRIMHEYQARPGLTATGMLLPAHQSQLPLLDIFIIKLFAAPCKFAEPPTMADVSNSSTPKSHSLSSERSAEPTDHPKIAPNIRTELTRIATRMLKFLDKVSQVKSCESAIGLLSDKESLLNSLKSWLVDLEAAQRETRSLALEPVSVSFMRLFYSTLRIVLLGALECSSNPNIELKAENHQFQDIANIVDERLRDYSMDHGIGNGVATKITVP